MDFRLQEYTALFYRIFLVYLCYFFCRLMFVYFNNDLVHVKSIYQMAELCYYGLRFDNVAIVYSNIIFILMSIIPWKKTTHPLYQKVVFWIYWLCNGFFLSLNFIDFAYYRFNQNRLMNNFLEVIEFESNKIDLLLNFLASHSQCLSSPQEPWVDARHVARPRKGMETASALIKPKAHVVSSRWRIILPTKGGGEGT